MIGSRSVFGNAGTVSDSSRGRSALDLTPLVPADSGSGGERPVASESEGREPLVMEKR